MKLLTYWKQKYHYYTKITISSNPAEEDIKKILKQTKEIPPLVKKYTNVVYCVYCKKEPEALILGHQTNEKFVLGSITGSPILLTKTIQNNKKFIQIALEKGYTLNIRQATEKEMSMFKKKLSEFNKKT